MPAVHAATVPHETLPPPPQGKGKPRTRKQRKAELEASTSARATEANESPDTVAPTGSTTITFIVYEVGRDECKEIVQRGERDHRRLGEIAHNIETRYGDRTLAKLAEDSGISACTLERHRSVYRAWKEKPAPGPVCYAVLRALQNHPDRHNIVAANPQLTKSAAQKLAAPYKDNPKAKCEPKPEQQQGEENAWTKHNRAWFKNLVTHAREAASAADEWLEATPEKQHEMLQIVEPGLVMYLRGNGHTLVRIADELDALLEQAQKHDAEAEAFQQAAA